MVKKSLKNLELFAINHQLGAGGKLAGKITHAWSNPAKAGSMFNPWPWRIHFSETHSETMQTFSDFPSQISQICPVHPSDIQLPKEIHRQGTPADSAPHRDGPRGPCALRSRQDNGRTGSPIAVLIWQVKHLKYVKLMFYNPKNWDWVGKWWSMGLWENHQSLIVRSMYNPQKSDFNQHG